MASRHTVTIILYNYNSKKPLVYAASHTCTYHVLLIEVMMHHDYMGSRNATRKRVKSGNIYIYNSWSELKFGNEVKYPGISSRLTGLLLLLTVLGIKRS